VLFHKNTGSEPLGEEPPAYRNDITGLRAIAVGLILLFHLKVKPFGGGFIGVDVFFVISGYLITRSLLRTKESLGLKDVLFTFYARRVRRLFPALLTTVLATVLVGYLILGPSAFSRLATSAWATVFSVSNVYFLLSAGYWEPASDSLPLLHTWSLGVEEQFYLIWPVLILGLLAHTRKIMWVGLLILTCLSLLASVMLSGISESMAFYLMPIRFFQFAIGAFCVLLDKQYWSRNKLTKVTQHFIFCISLIGIFASAVIFNADTVYPGIAALVPTLGSAGVIISRSPIYFRYVLENPVSNWIGFTSYSIYLVHWPVIVFLQISFSTLSPQIKWLAVFLTLVFSTLQHYLIEERFRAKSKNIHDTQDGVKKRNFFALTFAFLPVLGLIGLGLDNHFKQRTKTSLPKAEIMALDISPANKSNETMRNERYAEYSALCRKAKSLSVCGEISKDKPNIIILGDSHTVQWFNTLTYAYPDLNFLASAVNGCIFSTHYKSGHKCHHPNKERLSFLDQNKSNIHTLVIGNRHYANTPNAIQNTTLWARNMGLNVAIVGPGLELTQPYQDIVERLELDNLVTQNFDKYRYMEPKKAFDNRTSEIIASGAIIIDPLEYFCPNNICILMLDRSTPTLLDSHHISLPASLAYGLYLKNEKPNLFSDNQHRVE